MLTVAEAERIWAAANEDFTSFLPQQIDAFTAWEGLDKLLVFYPTGKGKTIIMLTMMALRGEKFVTVVAPPITHAKWIKDGDTIGVTVLPMSHAKFRQGDTKFSRTMPLIVDEFHLLGGHTGKGWKKLDTQARGMRAPLVLGSATPNYNDAERCYCLVHVLDPIGNKGGYLFWLYTHCITRANPYAAEPFVEGFINHSDAEGFLSAQPNVVYVPDEAPDIIQNHPIRVDLPDEFLNLNLDMTRERIMASDMEIRQRTRFRQIIGEDGRVREEVAEELSYLLGNYASPIMIFCAHKEIAKIVYQLHTEAELRCGYIDGDTSLAEKNSIIGAFCDLRIDFLVGTSSMATGTDGIDKVCDVMVILDDTDDDAQRRQLIGRILPRGDVKPEDYVGKVAYRFVYSS